MKYRPLKIDDILNYKENIYSCYKCNSHILDSQSPLNLNSPDLCADFLAGFILGEDSIVYGIFDEKEAYLYGIIIFDHIRTIDKTCAEVHIATDKAIWGKVIKGVYEDVLDFGPVDILYCQIPQIATHAIAMVKRLGFKKTGYIPCALPYVNSKGEEKLYDINIFTWMRRKEEKVSA